MKKILVLGNFPPPTGGIGTCIEQMFNSRLSEKYDLIKFDTTKRHIFSYWYITKILIFVFNLVRFSIVINTTKIRIIHFHTCSNMGFWQPTIYLQIAKFFGKKTIFHMHGASFKEFYQASDQKNKVKIRNILNKVDQIIVLSEQWKKYYSILVESKKISVINNATEDIDYSKYRRIYPKKTYICLFLSSICQRKGAYDLLLAFSKIKNKDIRLVFVGPIEDSNRFHSKINELNLADRCTIIGEIYGKKRFQYFASADCFILPSYAEGLPIAILEAMSFGLPIISSKVGAIPEVVTDENGILITPGKVAELISAINTLAQNKKLSNRMSKNNKLLIKQKYSLKIFSDKIQNVYEKLELE